MQKLNLIDRTAQFLAGGTKTSAQIWEQKAAVMSRLAEIESRVSFLTKRGLDDARETGDAATVEAMTQEMESLKNESKTLHVRRARLHREYTQASAKELVKNAKSIKADVAEYVAEVERLQLELDRAKGRLDRAVGMIEQASRHDESPALKLDRPLAERAAVTKFGKTNMRQNIADRKQFADRLAGKPNPQKQDAGTQENAGIVGGNAA